MNDMPPVATPGPPAIYADYQATTPVDPCVLARMAPFWRDNFGNPHSSDHAVGWRADAAVREAASAVGGMIGADADEIVFTSGATEANNLAMLGLARRAPANRNRLLVSAVEHKCVLAAARALAERAAFVVELLPVDGAGRVDPGEVERRVDDDVLLVAVMAVNNEIGSMQDIPAIAGILAPLGIPLHCDAAQAPCAMHLGELARHAATISLSGHKMYGPQGIGALHIRREIQARVEPLMYGGGQQNGLRSGTIPLPLCVGMGEAAALIATDGAEEERRRVARRRDRFIELLRGLGVRCTLNGPPTEHRHPGNANLRFNGLDAKDILGALQPHVAASTGAACASGIPEPSHVLAAIGLPAAACDASARFSFGRFTSGGDVEAAAARVVRAVRELGVGSTSLNRGARMQNPRRA